MGKKHTYNRRKKERKKESHEWNEERRKEGTEKLTQNQATDGSHDKRRQNCKTAEPQVRHTIKVCDGVTAKRSQ